VRGYIAIAMKTGRGLLSSGCRNGISGFDPTQAEAFERQSFEEWRTAASG